MECVESTPEKIISQRFFNFKKWIDHNGCKYDRRITIPALDNGVIGISTCDQIQANKIIIAIPEKLIINVEKCYNHEQLKLLYRANDDLFDYEESDDAEFNILAVFVMYQKSKIIKGKRDNANQQFYSFWQPYLDSIVESETGMDWTQQELQGLSVDVLEEVYYFKRQISLLSEKVTRFLQKRKEFSGIDKKEMLELFNYSYKFVMTRCFGYCTPGTSLIPLADLMNHKCEGINHQLVNIEKQKSNAKDEHYQTQNGRLDMTLIGCGDRTDTDLLPDQQYLIQNLSMTYEDLQYLDRNQKQCLIDRINEAKLQENQIYQLNFFEESDEEDNDTDSDEEEKRKSEMDIIKMQEQEQMQLFKLHFDQIQTKPLKQVEQILKTIEEKEQQIEEKQKTNLTTDSTHLGKAMQQGQSKNSVLIQANHELHTQEKMKTETSKYNQIKQKIQSMKFDMQNSEESDQQDQFPWFKQQGTYFTISTSQSVKKNQPLYNCYGRRTNKFLLVWYGFTYPNNLYDSVAFRFYLNFQYEKDLDKLIFQRYYGQKTLLKGFKHEDIIVKSNELSRQFRLKKNHFDENLIIFLRLILMNQYEGQDLNKLFATIPSSIQYEIFVFQYFQRIVLKLFQKYPESRIGEWQKKSKDNYRYMFKATFFKEQRKILEYNLEMIDLVLKFLQEFQKDKSIALKCIYRHLKAFKILKKVRAYLKSFSDNLHYINYEGEDYQQDPQ